ncbi:MAG: DUF2029 domain-containing protein [Anaerolineales bacterium]|nr:DUF2029 domain-containing protein [Anaerolineales bacterium]
MKNWLRKLLSPIVILILVNLILGSFIFDDFGESWDENVNYLYGEKVNDIYRNVFERTGEERNYGPNNNKGYYGPFFLTAAEAVDQAVRPWVGDLPSKDVFHALYFTVFLMAVFSLYTIARRFLGEWAAFGVALLFNTQPVMFGHAFINPKDIPFMAFFLASVASGMWMLAAFPANKEESTEEALEQDSIFRLARKDWQGINSRNKRIFLVVVVLWCVFWGVTVLLGNVLDSGVERVVVDAYQAGGTTFLGRIFERYAAYRDVFSPDAYVQKAQIWVSKAIEIGLGILLLGIVAVLVTRMPSVVHRLRREILDPLLGEINLRFPYKLARSFTKGSVWIAGILVGLSTSIRVLGPAAGALVALYFFMKRKGKALAPLTAYVLIAALTTYLTWPILWGAPVRRFIEAAFFMADFPWNGNVLFEGVVYEAEKLPLWYFPKLLWLKFTWLVMPLFVLGTVWGVIWAIKRRMDRTMLLVLGLWFWGPFAMFLITQPTIYDNFRQFFFILPPLFLFGGVFLEFLFEKLKPVWMRVVLLVLLIVPGIVGNIRLHPYEYVYFNWMAGGMSGAFRQYELDYWATSFNEAVEYLNANAPEFADVIVWGPVQLVSKYAREDLEVFPATEETVPDSSGEPLETYNYIVQTTRRNFDLTNPIEGEVVFQVGRDGAVFVTVTRLP